MDRNVTWVRRTATGMRIFLGLLFIWAAVGYFMMVMSGQEPPMDGYSPEAIAYNAGLEGSGFFMPFLKITELIVGLMLLTRRWTPLALLIAAPIIVNIIMYDFFLAVPMMADSAYASLFGMNVFVIIMGQLCLWPAIFLAWYHWDKYAPLFKV